MGVKANILIYFFKLKNIRFQVVTIKYAYQIQHIRHLVLGRQHPNLFVGVEQLPIAAK
jgi:hypothetical protein